MMETNFYLLFANLLDYPKKGVLSLFENFLKTVKKSYPSKIPEFETLELEYTKLFINAYPFVPAPPYASFYINSVDVYNEVENYYKKAEYLIEARDFPPDYLIYELIFLSNLLNDKKAGIEREFLEEHFLPWFEKFSQKVKENDGTGFYYFLCENTNTFLKNRLKELRNGKTDIPS